MPQDQFYNNYFSPENLTYASHKWSDVQEICGKALNTVDFCFCVFHVHGQKQYYLSDRDYLFRSCMDSCIFQSPYHLVKKIFTGICKEADTKTGDRAVSRSFLPSQQPHKVDIDKEISHEEGI